MSKPVQYIPMYAIERAAGQAGHHWFEPASKRFFGSRVAQEAYQGEGGTFFVSSEQQPRSNHPRLYSIRMWTEHLPGGHVDISTIGEFQAYSSRSGAHAAAKACANGTPPAHIVPLIEKAKASVESMRQSYLAEMRRELEVAESVASPS
jgi:hypothetical protein